MAVIMQCLERGLTYTPAAVRELLERIAKCRQDHLSKRVRNVLLCVFDVTDESPLRQLPKCKAPNSLRQSSERACECVCVSVSVSVCECECECV